MREQWYQKGFTCCHASECWHPWIPAGVYPDDYGGRDDIQPFTSFETLHFGRVKIRIRNDSWWIKRSLPG